MYVKVIAGSNDISYQQQLWLAGTGICLSSFNQGLGRGVPPLIKIPIMSAMWRLFLTANGCSGP